MPRFTIDYDLIDSTEGLFIAGKTSFGTDIVGETWLDKLSNYEIEEVLAALPYDYRKIEWDGSERFWEHVVNDDEDELRLTLRALEDSYSMMADYVLDDDSCHSGSVLTLCYGRNTWQQIPALSLSVKSEPDALDELGQELLDTMREVLESYIA